jgi:hypothetical protein
MTDLNLPIYPKKVQVSIEYCVPCDYSDYALVTLRHTMRKQNSLQNARPRGLFAGKTMTKQIA